MNHPSQLAESRKKKDTKKDTSWIWSEKKLVLVSALHLTSEDKLNYLSLNGGIHVIS